MSPRAGLLALLIVLALGLCWTLRSAPHHRGEKRSDEIVSEMLETGEWLFPPLHGAARLQKPPLYWWAGAAAARVSGEEPALSLRAVSVAAALGLVIVLYAWAAHALDPATGLAAAACLAAMTQVWLSARLGTADMLLVLFTTAALAAFQRLTVTRDSRLLPLLAGLVTLAFLTKATAALVDVFVPVLTWLAAKRKLGLLVRPRVLAWSAVAACASLAWYVAALEEIPEAGARLREFFFVPLGAGHSDLASDHYRPVWWYLPRLLGAALPAVLLLPLVIRDAIRFRFWRDVPALRFAGMSVLSLFVVWSLIPQKGRHYLLPLLPPLALLLGDSLVRAWRRV